MQLRCLVTGGLGYIGSHVVSELTRRGHAAFVVDEDAISPNLKAVTRLTDRAVWRMTVDEFMYDGHLQDATAGGEFDAIVNLASYISVAESTNDAHLYWCNNIISTMDIARIKTPHLIFASTGTAFNPANPYANSKLACERYIQDVHSTGKSDFDGFTTFRFFNVSGLEDGLKPTGTPTHLIRVAALAAKGLIPEMTIYGDDWETKDGTAVRDYIHVSDVAASIVNAVESGPSNTPYECLGTGKGYSVLEVIQSMKHVTGVDFDVKIAPRRPGDVASMVCDSQYRHITLNHDLNSMCFSAWKNI